MCVQCGDAVSEGRRTNGNVFMKRSDLKREEKFVGGEVNNRRNRSFVSSLHPNVSGAICDNGEASMCEERKSLCFAELRHSDSCSGEKDSWAVGG